MEMMTLAESDELVEIGVAIVIGMVGVDPDDDGKRRMPSIICSILVRVRRSGV